LSRGSKPARRARHLPSRGVLAVLGFNFPRAPPNDIVPALATGNAVVFKPSDLTPAVGALLVALWREAGLPDGALEIVQGGADVGRNLALHAGIDGVLFTGSWAAGRALAEATLDQPGKLLALEMGGRNAMLVCADADLDAAPPRPRRSICATTGSAARAVAHLRRRAAHRRTLTERSRGCSRRRDRALARTRARSWARSSRAPPTSDTGVALSRPRAQAGGHARAFGETELPPPFAPGLRFRRDRASTPTSATRLRPDGARAVADLEQAIALLDATTASPPP
jgi:hypothetical protein